MNHLLSITAILTSLVFTAACHKSTSGASTQTARATHPGADGGRRVAPTPRAQEVARGDLREALLLLQRVHFGFDSDELRPEARESLAQAAAHLSAHPEIQVYVDGHTDERGTTEYNIALGERRARIVSDYLVRLGVDRNQLSPISFGEETPLRDGHSADDLATNRRVDFRLMRGDIRLVLEDGARFGDDGTPIATTSAPTGPRTP